MRRLTWHWLPPYALLAQFALTTLLAPAALAAEAEDARSWLARIHAAANQRNYEGTMVFSAGGQLSSSRVAHHCIADQCYERLEALDGRQVQVYRKNDTVHTLWPQTRVAVVEKRTPLTSLPSSMQSVEPRALEQYALRTEGPDRVAGRVALVLLLQPRDELRYAQRLWADQATGLMLRADVIGPQGVVLESSAFSEVQIGVKPQPVTAAQGQRRLEGYRVVRPQQQHTQLEAEGWALERPVPGFTLSGCVKRPLAAVDAATSAQVLQAVFSDGLTHVSVFIEPQDARREYANLSGQVGATGTYRQRRDDHWITVMGEVPAATLKQFAQSLRRR